VIREVVLSRRARRQLFSALRWWDRHREKAPNAFDEDLAATLELLRHTPEVGQPVRAKRLGVRRILMERIRYYVYYRYDRLNASGTVEIIVIWHASRRPPLL
jgi:plasmid stabilization system protein ParE